MPVSRPSLALAVLAIALPVAPASAAVEFGASLAAAPSNPDGGAGPCPGVASLCTVVLVRDAAGRGAGAPADGVVVRLRLRAHTGSSGTFAPRVLRPQPGGAFALVASGTSFALGPGGDVQVFASRLPVRAGDVLGLRGDALPGTFADGTGSGVALFGEPPAWDVGSPAREPDAGPGAPGDLLLAGVLEPDADGDGYGDETQDACPVDAGRSGSCLVDLSVSPGAPAYGVEGQPFDHAFTVRNAGPSPATDVEVQIGPVESGELRAVAAPGACVTVGGGMRCSVGRLEPGGEATVRLTLAGAAGAVVRSSATASSPSADAAPGNETASAATTLTPPSVAPPPGSFVLVACANLVRGTGDDELLSGTGFGDRLVGGAGRDLMRGGAGDDCLEGGAGGDVLDGETGNDRLAGGAGHDRLRGGPGDDTLRGGLGNDVLIAALGRDLLIGGVGKDRFDAGAGNDTIDARDGVGETIDCGRGLDSVRVDRRDRFRGCERVRRR